MYIHGEFKNINDEIYSVHILNGDKSSEKIIGKDTIFFSEEPVNIQTICDDTFTHIIKKSCTIELLTKEYLGDYLFNAKDKVIVNVYKGNSCIFAGYVEPNVYSQPYANELDSLTINCTDFLSTLQYKYLTDNTTYKIEKLKADVYSFYHYIEQMGFYNNSLDIVHDSTTNVWYDQSKLVDGVDTFSDLAISENIFLGETEKDLMNNDAVLTEILQYLNLHIVQIGLDFYIFDWDSIRTLDAINWYNLKLKSIKTDEVVTEPITIDDYSSDGTNITISDVYNQIQVSCETESLEQVIESPLDSSKLKSPYNNYQRYMTELFSDGDGENAQNGFKDLMTTGTTSYEGGKITDWFIQIKENPNWNFYYKGEDLYNKLIERDKTGIAINQWKFPYFMKQNSYAACLLSLGKTESKSAQDDTPSGNISLTDYLAISVNGNYDSTESAMDNITTELESVQPICVYNGTVSGIYSPIDEDTTNYLVFSGNMVLAPLMQLSGSKGNESIFKLNNYQKTLNDYKSTKANLSSIKKLWAVPYGDNKYGCYYMHKFWEQRNPIKDYNVYNEADYKTMIYPFINIQGNEEFEYNYSSNGDKTDRINKVPVIECELKIGDKYCVEEYETDANGILQSIYNWYTLEECPTYTDDDGTVKHKTTFSLGFNPKIGDKILGKEYEIQKNFDYTYNIEADKGTAIPIRYSDNLVGAISFKILGPINTTWNQITRRHPTWLRHTKWTENLYSILAHTSTIYIKNFEAKIYSDNSGYSVQDDKDLVYVSDETKEYLKKKDDITFKINTALTSAEAIEAGVKNTINLSSVIRTSNRMALQSLTNTITNEKAKPEEIYCDAYYKEYNKPKIVLQTDLHDTSKISLFNRFKIGYIGKTFYPLKIDSNLSNGSVNITLKEL